MSRILDSVKEHWRKYVVVALATFAGLSAVYDDFALRVHRQELVASSILRLTPRNLPAYFQRTSGNTPKGGIDGPSSFRGYVPPEATIVLTPKEPGKKLDDVVGVSVTGRWGLCLEPGAYISIAPFGVGLDVKLLYAYKIGLEVGAVEFFKPIESASPTVGLSYRLDRFTYTKNTELVGFYAPLARFPYGAGIRVNF